MMLTNYYRRISALLPQKYKKHLNKSKVEQGAAVFITLFSISFTITLSILFFETYQVYTSNLKIQQESKQNLTYWESIIAKYPQFPAAYYEAAVYAAQLSQNEKARNFIQKALFIDPNFFEAEVLATELEKK